MIKACVKERKNKWKRKKYGKQIFPYDFNLVEIGFYNVEEVNDIP